MCKNILPEAAVELMLINGCNYLGGAHAALKSYAVNAVNFCSS